MNKKQNNPTFVDWTKLVKDITGDESLPPFTEGDQVIARQMEASRRKRRNWEGEWQANEASLFDTGAEGGAVREWLSGYRDVDYSADAGSETDVTDNFMGINLSNRNWQLIHSQLMSNTPVVMAVPVSEETSDKDAAIAAEAATTYARSQYELDNIFARAMAICLTYGTAFIKQVYDKSIGALVKVSDDGKIVAIGDHNFTVPRIWDMFADANATCIKDCKWLAERMWVPLEDCLRFFGEANELLLKSYVVASSAALPSMFSSENSLLYEVRFGVVEIYERWEPGHPENGYMGKLVYHLRDGRILKTMDSPCAHPWYPDSKGKKTQRARLPYSMITYEDIPNCFYGRSPAAKCNRAQNVLNGAYMVVLQTAQNMGVPHLVCNRAALGENPDEAFTNNSVNIIPLDLSGETGGTMPFTLKAAETSSDIKEIIVGCTNYINDAWGVTDAMLGKMSRETSGITTQLSIMQGNMIRERFFEKYVFIIEDVYKLFLADAAKNWKLERFMRVVGENSPSQADAIKGADISGGYVIRVERGTLFALDPITRQEQIINQLPLLQNAGVDPRFILRQLRVADYRTIYDKFDMADNRAKIILEKIKQSPANQPRIWKYEDHIGISAWLTEFTMTQEFEEMEDEIKEAIEAHIDARLKEEGTNRTPTIPAIGAPPAVGAAPAQGAGGLGAIFQGGQIPNAPPKIGPAR